MPQSFGNLKKLRFPITRGSDITRKTNKPCIASRVEREKKWYTKLYINIDLDRVYY